jgi:hypothetical protein
MERQKSNGVIAPGTDGIAFTRQRSPIERMALICVEVFTLR